MSVLYYISCVCIALSYILSHIGILLNHIIIMFLGLGMTMFFIITSLLINLINNRRLI